MNDLKFYHLGEYLTHKKNIIKDNSKYIKEIDFNQPFGNDESLTQFDELLVDVNNEKNK